MEKYDDFSLIEKSREGNMKAFRILVDRHKKGIYSLCYQMTSRHSDADDLSQETFIKAYEAVHKFRMQASFFTWLRKIAYNLTINHLKKRQRLRETPLDYKTGEEQKSVDPISITKETPHDQLQKKELGEKITAAMKCLSPTQKASVELVIQQGLTYKEASKIQGCPEGTVFWRIYQARKILKEKLKPYIRYCE